MFDHLLESSHRDDSNKWSNIGFGQEIKELASIEIHFTHLIWRSGLWCSTFLPVESPDDSLDFMILGVFFDVSPSPYII